jgi:hypothetical protein
VAGNYSCFSQNSEYHLGNAYDEQSDIICNSARFVAQFLIQFIMEVDIFLLLNFLISLPILRMRPVKMLDDPSNTRS